MLKLYQILLILLFIGCKNNNTENNNLTIDFEPCDTLVLFAVELIDDQDSVMNILEEWENRSFVYYDIIQENGVDSFKYPFLNVFHKKVDTSKICNFYGKDFFTDNHFTNYSTKGKEMKSVCMNEYLVVSQDSIDKMRTAFEKDELIGLFEYYTFSYPWFNNDSTYMIIEFTRRCYGLCGAEYTFVFRKDFNEWILDKKILRSVS